MARAERLVELMITIGGRQRFTAAALAAEIGVSRRTVMRDLAALITMGVPLDAIPGPGGGYEVVWQRRLLPLALSGDEALGLLLAYETLQQYAATPFTARGDAAITKLRNALPPPIVAEVDRIRRHVVQIERHPQYSAPLLEPLLQAAVERTHLRVHYQARRGASIRTIFPYGLVASGGFWYCACWDYRREQYLSLRADRVDSLTRVPDLPPREPIVLERWFDLVERETEPPLSLRLHVKPHAAKTWDIERAWGPLAADADGYIEATIPLSEVEWFASRIIAAGPDVVVESPPELIAAIRRRVHALALHYGSQPAE